MNMQLLLLGAVATDLCRTGRRPERCGLQNKVPTCPDPVPLLMVFWIRVNRECLEELGGAGGLRVLGSGLSAALLRGLDRRGLNLSFRDFHRDFSQGWCKTVFCIYEESPQPHVLGPWLRPFMYFRRVFWDPYVHTLVSISYAPINIPWRLSSQVAWLRSEFAG